MAQNILRMFICALGIFLMLLFSIPTIFELFLFGVGLLLAIVGIYYDYRLPPITGIFIIIIGAAESIEIETLLEFDDIIRASLGILIPIALILWALLSTDIPISIKFENKRFSIFALLFSIICIFSAPLSMLLAGHFMPAISIKESTLLQISIVMVTMISGFIIVIFWNRQEKSYAIEI